MKTNTTVRWARSQGTAVEPVSALLTGVISHRMSGMHSAAFRKEPVVLQGRYVVSAGGEAQVAVSVDQKAFKRTMAVREINSQMDSRSSVDSAEGISATVSR